MLPELRVRRALAHMGVATPTDLTPVDSVNNEVWMADALVVRLSCKPEQRLRREASLARLLPPGVGYPPIVAYGAEIGSEWLILRRLSGLPLSRCWPHMGNDARRNAITQLAGRLRLIHGTATPALPPLRDLPQPIDPAPSPTMAVARLMSALERAGRLPHVDKGLMAEAADFVAVTAPVLEPFNGRTLIHGDLTFENVLWDPRTEELTAVLDFEWARGAPRDMELDVLLRFIAYPELHVAPDYAATTHADDYRQVPFWLADVYPELFSAPRQLDRCRLYAIAWDVREILQFPPLADAGRLDGRHPYRRIQATLSGTSHLDHLNEAVAAG